MATNRGQKRAGLTAAVGTHGHGQLTPPDAPLLTPARGTRHYTPRARKCARKGCTALFKPHAKHGKYCSEKCRKADARRRKAKTVKTKPADPILVLTECLYCHHTFLAEQGRGAKYCTDSHKELASRQRRAATIDAVQVIVGDSGGMTRRDVEEFVEREGMKRVRALLTQQSYVYDEQARAWLLPVSVGAFVEQEVG